MSVDELAPRAVVSPRHQTRLGRHLSVASHDDTSRELELLVDRREGLVTIRTATINRLLWRVHELDPAWAPPAKSLDVAKRQQALRARLSSVPEGGVVALVAELALAELGEVFELNFKINALANRIEQSVREDAPTLPGVGPLTAGKLVGEAAGIGRFKSEAAFARHAGIAPLPVWSGNTAGRVRLTRSGNRQFNPAIHRIAITQIRIDGLGQAYHRKKKAEGMSNREAPRSYEPDHRIELDYRSTVGVKSPPKTS